MAGIGDVLRNMGSVLNPQVNQQVEAEYAQKQAQAQQMQQLQLQQLIKGVESGAIDPARLKGSPLEGMVGQSPETQARLQALKNEQGFRAAVASLDPEAPDYNVRIAAAANQFGKPEIAASAARAAEERKTREQTAALARQQRIDEITLRGEQEIAKVREQEKEKRITKEEADARERSMRESLAKLVSSLRPAPQPRALQLTTDAQGNQLIVSPDGTTRPLTTESGDGVKKSVSADKPMTEFQGKSSLYGTRAAQSDKVLKALEDTVSLPGLAAGQATGVIGNMLMSSEQRRITQAQRDFVNAILRQESGAVISDAEFDNAKKQYFPAPGDDKATLDQKRANRQLAIQGFARMSGPKGAEEINAIIKNEMLPGVSPNAVTPQQNSQKVVNYEDLK